MTLKDLINIAEGYEPDMVEIKIVDYHDGATATLMDYSLEPFCQDRPESGRRTLQIETLFGL